MLRHAINTTARIWAQFHAIEDHLNHEDDPALWREALGQIIGDAEYLVANNRNRKLTVVAHLGCCSHWLRPHQSRWVADADGGFAAPIGYGGSGYRRNGLPEFDWSLRWQWDHDLDKWGLVKKPKGKRRLEFRVAIPSRSTRHRQAAVHTQWQPGTPADPNNKATQFYGFRKREAKWELAAHWSRLGEPYEGELEPR